MRTDSRLSRMLHVLLHMAWDGRPVTSERIAAMIDTNPAVVRRTLSGLRKAGYVNSEKGHGGGWRLACDLQDVTLIDIYRAVGSDRIFAIGFDHENPDCAVERVVNASIREAMQQAETILIERLGAVSLADLASQFDVEMKRHR